MPRKLRKSSRPTIIDEQTRELCELMARYPFRWFSQEKVGAACGFGPNVMTALAALGAPRVGRKMNVHTLQRWIEDNPETVGGKIRE